MTVEEASQFFDRVELTTQQREIAEKLLEEIRDYLYDQGRVNRAIAQIDTLRARIDAFGPTYDLVLQITQKSELRRFQSDWRITAAKLSGLELQRKQTERDIENVRAIAEAAGEFQRLMDEVIQKLKAFTDPVVRQRAAYGDAEQIDANEHGNPLPPARAG